MDLQAYLLVWSLDRQREDFLQREHSLPLSVLVENVVLCVLSVPRDRLGLIESHTSLQVELAKVLREEPGLVYVESIRYL